MNAHQLPRCFFYYHGPLNGVGEHLSTVLLYFLKNTKISSKQLLFESLNYFRAFTYVQDSGNEYNYYIENWVFPLYSVPPHSPNDSEALVGYHYCESKGE